MVIHVLCTKKGHKEDKAENQKHAESDWNKTNLNI